MLPPLKTKLTTKTPFLYTIIVPIIIKDTTISPLPLRASSLATSKPSKKPTTASSSTQTVALPFPLKSSPQVKRPLSHFLPLIIIMITPSIPGASSTVAGTISILPSMATFTWSPIGAILSAVMMKSLLPTLAPII